jgi:hypothetical protein
MSYIKIVRNNIILGDNAPVSKQIQKGLDIAFNFLIPCSWCYMLLMPSTASSKMNPMMISSSFMCSCVVGTC